MLLLKLLSSPLLVYSIYSSPTLAQNLLPPSPDAEIQAPVEAAPLLYEYVISEHIGLKKRGVLPHPRLSPISQPNSKRMWENSSPAMAKRMLLGERAIVCDPGYSLCNASGRCCPIQNNQGRCCNDGTCIMFGDQCCSGGSACPSGQDCCPLGCKQTQNTCCTDDWSCPPGTKCCGDQNCAPSGGECCNGRTSCDNGLHCVVLNGVQGCCRDYTCSEFDNSGTGGGAVGGGSGGNNNNNSPSSPTATSGPAAATTLPSITLPSITLITNTGNVVGGNAGGARYFSTTWTYTFVSFFLTTLPPATTPTPTSSVVTTSSTIRFLGQNSAQAQSFFSLATAGVTPRANITAPGYNTATQQQASSRASVTSAKAGGSGSGSGSGATNAGSRIRVVMPLALMLALCTIMMML